MQVYDPAGSVPARVLLFDSGVGGLSIARHLRKSHPNLIIDYLIDNAFLPYGEKSQEQICARLPQLLRSMVARCHSDLVILACNTASTSALAEVRRVVDVPVVGTVPAIKPAAQLTKTGVLGLLATPATVESNETAKLIAAHAADCHVVHLGSAGLVRLAEAKLRGHVLSSRVLHHAIGKLFRETDAGLVDCVVLGCTHFPLIKDELELAAPRPVLWVDSGEAIARRVGEVLKGACNARSGQVQSRAYFTKWTPGLGALRNAFSADGFTDMTWTEAPDPSKVAA